MTLLSELSFALGYIAATAVKGAANAVLGNLVMLDTVEDDEEAETSPDEPLYGPIGFYFRPDAPVKAADATGIRPEGRPEVVAVRLGDRVLPLTYRDLRLSSQVDPDEGEGGLAHYGGGFISLKWNTSEDGTSIVIYAPRKDSTGTPIKASAISIDSEEANAHVCLMHEYGHSLTLTKEGKIVLANKVGDAYLEVNDDGCTINGNFAVKGAVRDLSVGNPATAEGLMMSADMLSWITQVNAFLAVLGPLFNAPPGNVQSGGPGTVIVPTAVPKASTIAKASQNAV